MNVSRRQFVDAICIGLRAAPDLPQDARNALLRHARTAQRSAVLRFFVGDCQCPVSACGITFDNSDPSAPRTRAVWNFIVAFDDAMKVTAGVADRFIRHGFTVQIQD